MRVKGSDLAQFGQRSWPLRYKWDIHRHLLTLPLCGRCQSSLGFWPGYYPPWHPPRLFFMLLTDLQLLAALARCILALIRQAHYFAMAAPTCRVCFRVACACPSCPRRGARRAWRGRTLRDHTSLGSRSYRAQDGAAPTRTKRERPE